MADKSKKPKRGQSAARIAELEAQVAALTAERDSSRFATEVGNVLVTAATAGIVSAPMPVSSLLQMIVETAEQVLGARASSLLLVDPSKTHLTFEVTTGPVAEEVKKLMVPMGSGIAGLVAASGQPMAVAEAQQSKAHLKDIGDRVGFLPETILCVPLYYRDEVIGVLEVMDKIPIHPPGPSEAEGKILPPAPSEAEREADLRDLQTVARPVSFTQKDIATLSAFANQAAVAIELSRTAENIARLTGELLKSVHGESSRAAAGLRERIESLAGSLTGAEDYQRALAIAALVHEIADNGETATESCLKILRALADCLPRTRR